MQTIIFVAIFDRTSSGSNSDIDDISRYFECSTLDIVEHKKDFDKLLSGGLIEKVRGRRECTNFTSANFRVPTIVFEAILCDEPLNNAKSVQSEPDYFDLVKEIGEWLENRDKDEMSTATFLAQTKELEESFSSCDFVKKVRNLLPDIEYRIMFYDICKDNFIDERKKNNYKICKLERMVCDLEADNKSLPLVKATKRIMKNIPDRIFFYEMCNDSLHGCTNLETTLDDIYDKQQDILEVSTRWKNEEHPLQTLGLAELGGESFFGSTKVELTDEGRELFFQKDAEKFKRKEKTNDVLSVDKIKAKNLYFSPALRKQLDFLSDSIQPEAFESLQNRLKEKGLPTGVAAIFYGTPGTGKTESVYQLAKASGRDVMQVDISEMKTCWYGESQKLVKGVFRKYERLCQKSRKAPILLFNEADAVFGKRMEQTTSSVDQTENAIQNIILEQMEKLQGILIATTNLEGNLDAAFERRFLFKVKFEKPGIEAKRLIWQDKLPLLTESDADTLAAEYDFTGGEIDNIVRKATMNEVLTGNGYSLDYLRELCSQEHLSKKCGNIGFNR